MQIGDLVFGFRGDGAPLEKDAKAAGLKAGETGGKAFEGSFSGRIGKMKADLAKGGGIPGALMGGIGLGAGLGAFNLITGGIGKVVDVLGDAVQAAVDDEASISRLTQSLKANVPAWDGNTKAIEDNIAAKQRLGFDDESLRDSLAVLVGATHDVTEAQHIQNTAMDLARFKRIDLQTATEALIKVEGGAYRSLKQLGIKLKDGATSTEALAAVQKVASGQAEAYAETTAGAQEAFNIAASELVESLGKGLIPVMGTLVDIGSGAIEVITNLGNAFGDLQKWISSIGNDTAEVTDEISRLAESFGTTPEVVAAFVKGQEQAAGAIEQTRKESEALLSAFRNTYQIFGDLTPAQKQQYEDWKKSAEGLAVLTGELVDTTDATEASLTSTEKATKTLREYARFAQLASAANLDLATFQQEVTDRMLATGGTTEQVLFQINKELGEGAFAPIGAAAADAYSAAYITSWNEAWGGKATDVITTTIPKTFDTATNEALGVITGFVASATVEMERVDNKKGKGWHWSENISTRLHDLKVQFRDDLHTINYLLAHPGGAQKTRNQLVKELEHLEKKRAAAAKVGNWEAFGKASEAILKTQADLDRLDGDKATISIEMKAYASLTDLARKFVEAGGLGGYGYATPRKTRRGDDAFDRFRASGGPVSRGMPYIVGERGPETFVPEGNGTILPHGRQRVDFYVHDANGGIARAGMSTAELANAIRRWED